MSLLLKKSSTGNNPFDVFASGKPTSCAIHFVNGNAIYFTSRSQKVVPQNPNGIQHVQVFQMHCSSSIAVNFLTSSTTGLSLRLDNNGTRFLTQKTGSGKIKHMAGKYLWMQQLVDAQTLDVKKISKHN